jgi:antitoxin MazE
MSLKVKKWGNGYGILLPKVVLEKMELTENQALDFVFENNQFILKKRTHKEYTLEDILKKAKKKSFHKETDWGSDVGAEIWEY